MPVSRPLRSGDEARDDVVVDDKGDRVARKAWVRAEIDRWNRDLDAAGRAAKYQKIAASPFAFFRGTNHLFWRDHVGRADLGWYGGARTATWIQGDCHLENFGTFDDERTCARCRSACSPWGCPASDAARATCWPAARRCAPSSRASPAARRR